MAISWLFLALNMDSDSITNDSAQVPPYQPIIMDFVVRLSPLSIIGTSLCTSFFILILMATGAHPLGINCRGSNPNCWSQSGIDDTLFRLLYLTESDPSLGDAVVYSPGSHIVCRPWGAVPVGGICAFTQGSNLSPAGINGTMIRLKLNELVDHGCRACGSVPLSEDNNPFEAGILTVNYVLHGPICNGLCHYS